QQIISILFLIENKKWNIELLKDLFYVSRNTILKDIKEVKKYFATFGIHLSSHRKRGYFFDCDELQRRKVLFQYMYAIEINQKKIITEFLFNCCEIKKLSNHFIHTIIYQVNQITQQDLKKKLVKQDMYIILKTLLFVIYFRSQKGHIPVWPEKEKQEICHRYEYIASRKILDI